MTLTAIILTYNEEIHLERCISSIRECVDDILVVDSFSDDETVAIAQAQGANVLVHEFRDYATQFNWALNQVAQEADWILRIDADEYLTTELMHEIQARLPTLEEDVAGVSVERNMVFLGDQVRYGGLYPVRLLRIFRRHLGHCEWRWMDEHIKVSGLIVNFDHGLIDDNKKSLTWWIDKHNGYASREAIDLLNLEYRFIPLDTIAGVRSEAGSKRFLKEHFYSRLPLGVRALLYYLYRYVLFFGFLDREGARKFHFLQGFWYRYLVDAKVKEVKSFMVLHPDSSIEDAIEQQLGIDVRLNAHFSE
jgi:glycosyltransferase involved in cell wall biosynthesis